MKSTLLLFLTLTFPILSSAATIPDPVLRQNGGKATACLERVMRTKFNPGESIAEWKGPGVRADGAGQVDPSTALYVFRVQPSDRWFGIAFYSTDETGWRIFSYTDEGNKLQIGYRAKSMESTGYLFGVKPHNSIEALDEGDYQEIDLSPCADVLTGL